MSLVPAGEEAKFLGFWVFAGRLGTILPPLLYTGIVQALNDHRIGQIHIAGYTVVAALIIATIDFDRGAKDVEDHLKFRQGFSGRLAEKTGHPPGAMKTRQGTAQIVPSAAVTSKEAEEGGSTAAASSEQVAFVVAESAA